jgi:hypothetical protein
MPANAVLFACEVLEICVADDPERVERSFRASREAAGTSAREDLVVLNRLASPEANPRRDQHAFTVEELLTSS